MFFLKKQKVKKQKVKKMPSISPANKQESKDFMNALNDMLEIIESIAPLITDNNYLLLFNGLKKLNDNAKKEEVIRYIEVVVARAREDRVVSTHQKRIKMKEKDPAIMLSDADKLKRGWKICERCDRLVKDVKDHQFTEVCKRIKDTKLLTFRSKTLTTNVYANYIHRLRAIFIEYEGFKYWMKVIKYGIVG